MEEKTFGLVVPEEYALPSISPLWSGVAYAAFDISADPNQAKDKKNKEVLRSTLNTSDVTEVYSLLCLPTAHG